MFIIKFLNMWYVYVLYKILLELLSSVPKLAPENRVLLFHLLDTFSQFGLALAEAHHPDIAILWEKE